MNQLHPGARWIFRLQAYSRFVFIGILIVVWNLRFLISPGVSSISVWLFRVLLFYILFVVVVGEIYARMSYKRWLYEISPEEVKIEKGIIWKKYTSIPYERIQNVDVRRGVIARIFGFSSMEIETAGQSGLSGGYRSRIGGRRKYHSEGYLPAIEMGGAEKIRIFIMKKINRTNTNKQGL